MSIVIGVLLLAGGIALIVFRHWVGDGIRGHDMRKRWSPMGLSDEWQARYGVPIFGVLMTAAGITMLVADIVRFAWR